MKRPDRSKVNRGIIYLMTGTIGAQIISFIALPFLSRLFTPEQFGYYSLVIAIAGLVIPVSTFRLESAAMLPKEIEQVRALAWMAITSTVVVSLATTLVIHILSSARLLELAPYPFIEVWVGVFILMSGLFSIFSQLSLREQLYGLVARRSFIRSLVTAVSQLGLGFVPRTVYDGGLLLGGIAGQAAGLIAMAHATRAYVARPPRGQWRNALREYWRFPTIFTPSAVLNALGLHAPVIFFTTTFGVAIGGQLGMADRIVAIPIALIGAAVGQVLDAEVSRYLREERQPLLPLYIRFSALLGIAGVVVIALGTMLGGIVVPWLLGHEWALAGTMVQILAVTAGLRLVAGPLSKFLIVLQKSLANTALDVLRVVLVGVAMAIVSALSLDLTSALWCIYIALSTTYVATWACGLVVVARHRITPMKLALES